MCVCVYSFSDSFPLCYCSVAMLCLTLCNPVDCSTSILPVTHCLPQLLKLMSIESVMQSIHLILCCPLLLLPSIFPCIKVFSTESTLPIKRPKYWSFSFSISLSSEYLGFQSIFRISTEYSIIHSGFPLGLTGLIS